MTPPGLPAAPGRPMPPASWPLCGPGHPPALRAHRPPPPAAPGSPVGPLAVPTVLGGGFGSVRGCALPALRETKTGSTAARRGRPPHLSFSSVQ